MRYDSNGGECDVVRNELQITCKPIEYFIKNPIHCCVSMIHIRLSQFLHRTRMSCSIVSMVC